LPDLNQRLLRPELSAWSCSWLSCPAQCICGCPPRMAVARIGCCTGRLRLTLDHQLGNERERSCDQYRRRSAATCPVREYPPDTLVVRPIGHAAGTIMGTEHLLANSARVRTSYRRGVVYRRSLGDLAFRCPAQSTRVVCRCGQLWWSTADFGPSCRCFGAGVGVELVVGHDAPQGLGGLGLVDLGQAAAASKRVSSLLLSRRTQSIIES
jgi:hypothetical protein